MDQVEAAARGCWRAAAGGLRVLRQRLRQSGQRGPRGGAGARSGPTATSPPRPRCCRDPRVRALLDRYAQRRPATGGGQLPDRLQQDLRGHGFDGELLVVQSNGGVMSRETACDVPVRTALSGPAAGVIACAAIARAAGLPDVVTGDMGGTSFDVSLVAGGEVSLAAQTAIEFGMVVRAPMIQIETIGAGGGSIASVDAGGLLQVGPESAGSNPGPACYGRGNTAHRHRRQCAARPHRGRPAAGRRTAGAAGCRTRARGHRRARGPAAGPGPAGGGRGHPHGGQRQDGRRDPRGVDRARPRSRKFAYMPFGGGGASAR